MQKMWRKNHRISFGARSKRLINHSGPPISLQTHENKSKHPWLLLFLSCAITSCDSFERCVNSFLGIPDLSAVAAQWHSNEPVRSLFLHANYGSSSMYIS